MPLYHKSMDGVESQFGVNFLANFLLMKLQLPKLQSAGPSSSIIIVASNKVRGTPISMMSIIVLVHPHAPLSSEVYIQIVLQTMIKGWPNAGWKM